MAGYKNAVATRKGSDVVKPDGIDTRMCRANGCQCVGSFGADPVWFCSWHANQPAEKWQAITRGLREHDWLIGFITTAMKMHQSGKDDELRKFAHDFWAESDGYMLLTDYEAKHLPLYLLRLRDELAYRVGTSQRRPAPRTGPMQLPSRHINNLSLPEAA
jgi:hypothetical protein